MDGVACSIVLANTFDRDCLTYWYATYRDIDEIIKRTNFDNYDYVIMTDISPHDPTLIEGKDNLILLDHHETALPLHNLNKKRNVVIGQCAGLLTQDFCERLFGISLSYLDDFLKVVNDYDMWINNDQRGKELNELFYLYWGHRFRKRFLDGHIMYTENEKEYLKQRQIELTSMYEDLQFYPLEKINAAIICANSRINDLCDSILMKEGYDIVFCRIPKTHSISVRTNLDTIHIGNILREYDPLSGGGHARAGAIENNGTKQFQTIITELENIIYTKLQKKGK